MTTYCINLSNRQVTEYTNFDALAFERIDGKMYAICTDGIYLIGNGETANADDNGTPITAIAKLGMTDFKNRNLKRMPVAYVASEGTITLGMGLDGNAVTADYDATHTGAGIGTHRIKLGKGHKSRYWQPIIKNVAGANFEVDAIDVDVVETARGVS